MNQILVTEKIYVTPELKRKKKMYKLMFVISLFCMICLSTMYIYAEVDRNKESEVSNNILQNMFADSTIVDRSPLNLDVNDLAACRTVKEVLDTLCLIKQIHNDDLGLYEYSYEEVPTECFDLERSKNPDVRYYACVVDKNRAGAKPKVVFRLNLAYNEWEELGYLRLKTKN